MVKRMSLPSLSLDSTYKELKYPTNTELLAQKQSLDSTYKELKYKCAEHIEENRPV